jgi:LysM repeat protein
MEATAVKTERPDDNDSLELYSEEMARNAVGGLFDDEPEPKSTSGRFVTGFDKEHTLDETPPDVIKTETMTITRGIMREPNPTPKPALRASRINPRDKSIKSSRSIPMPHSTNSDADYPDEYDTFRKRYKNHEAVPAPRDRGVKPSERDKGRRQPAAAYPPDDYEETDVLPALRWAGIVAVAVVIIVTGFLVYRITYLSGQLREANLLLAADPVSDAQLTELLLTIEEKDEVILALQEEVERFTNSSGPIVVWDPAGDENGEPGEEQPGEGITRPDDSNEAPPSVSGTSSTYTVVSGDNLTRIASNFYGSTHPDIIQRIRDANGLTNDNLYIGQTLTIPAQ